MTTADSEKQEKRRANRVLRRKIKEALHNNRETYPLLREVSNIWTWSKDGKVWWGSRLDRKYWRK